MPTIPKHNRPSWLPERKPFARRKVDNQAFYNSTVWRKTRAAFVANNPLCAECEKNGLYVGGEEVDHITPINQGGAKLDWDNLQHLCKSCHSRKSAKERSHEN